MIDLTTSTARGVADAVRRREVSAVEVARATLERIGRLDPALRAFITVTGDEALRAAERVDRDVAAGRALPLAGVPLAVKDGFHAKGVRTTAGSKVLADSVPGHDATAVARLKAAGCVLVGKASMHEFAFGFTNQNPHYGDCKNPWDPTRIPGGSSGGSAVALATSMCLAAIGGDTGGSVRMPAALCGVVGLKVTYGRVSRFGGIPLSWSMDTVGPMARTVGDAAALLQAMAGPDPNDPTTSRRPSLGRFEGPAKGLKGVRIGIPHNHFFEALEPDVAAASHEALEALKGLGATLIDVAFPAIDEVRGAHRAIIFSEAAAAHETLVRTRAADFGPDILPLLQAGLFLGAPQYLRAQGARRRIIAEYRRLWKPIDILATPTCPIAATPIGASTVRLGGADRPLVRVYLDHTLPFNFTGQPALSVPCGFTRSGLPIGLQLVGRPFDESLLLGAGAAYEAATTWHTRRPPGRFTAEGAKGAERERRRDDENDD
jgi:aspartyl-tRNA(Asn)/glutamyl-tRNA(Gln) amidotransferase subunit A